MAVKKLTTRIQLKHDVSTAWTSANLALLAGEFGWDSTENNFKIGDGTTGWNSINYAIPYFALSEFSITASGGKKVVEIGTVPISKIGSLTGYTTTGINGSVAATDSILTAIAKVENKANSAIAAAGVTSIDTQTGAFTTGNGISSANNTLDVATDSSDYLEVGNGGLKIDDSKVDSAYTTSNTTNLATVATVTSALNGLTDTLSGTPGAGNTITAFDEVGGKVAATFAPISITKSQISDFNGGDYATAAQGTKADSALQSISHGTDGNYVTVTVGAKDSSNNQAVSAAVTVQAISTASSSNMGLAEASDVKTYIDNKTADLSGAMHFRSVIDSTSSTVAAQINAYYTSASATPEVGDVFVDSATGAEWVVKTYTSGDITSANIEEFGRVNPDTVVTSVAASTSTTGLTVTPTTASTGAVTVTVDAASGYTIPTTAQMTKVDAITVNTTAKSVTDGTNTLTNIVSDANYAHITVTETSVSDGTATFNKYTHPTTTAANAAAVKVGKDGTGHVVLGDALTSADIATVTGDPQASSNPGTTVSSSLQELATRISGASAGTLDTTATTAQATDSAESLHGTVTLHKISKTASTDDLIQGNVLLLDCGSATTVIATE